VIGWLRWVLLLSILGALAFAVIMAGLFLTDPIRVSGLNGSVLGSSLARKYPGNGGGECAKTKRPGTYKCYAETSPPSSGENFRLVADDKGCWRARRVTRIYRRKHLKPGEHLPHRELAKTVWSGCPDLRDYIWPDKPYDWSD
jgi:hypothetical protein